jgi:ketosteroid isomerase-like protein
MTAAVAQEAVLEEQLIARWTAAYDTGDADTIGAVYAADARLRQGYCSDVAGRDAITEFWRSDLGDGGLTTRLDVADSFETSELIYLSGTYRVADAGAGESYAGSFTQIWRDDRGVWSVYREFWSNLACVDVEIAPSPGHGPERVRAEDVIARALPSAGDTAPRASAASPGSTAQSEQNSPTPPRQS